MKKVTMNQPWEKRKKSVNTLPAVIAHDFYGSGHGRGHGEHFWRLAQDTWHISGMIRTLERKNNVWPLAEMLLRKKYSDRKDGGHLK